MLETTNNSYHLQKYRNFTIQNFNELESYIKKTLIKEVAKFSKPSEIDAIKNYHDAIPTKPTIVFMGEIKAGKSTLINALLGEELVKAKSTVATAKNTYLDYGEEFAIYVHYHTGVKRKITLNQLEKYTVEETSTITMRNKVEYIQIYVPHPLLKAVRLVDSPGLNSQNEHHTKETEKLFEEATAIYWIFNHGMVGRKSEFNTLKQLNKLNVNIIGVVNMIDLHYEISDEPIESYLQDVEQKMSGHVKKLIGVSAAYAMDATEDEDDELWEDSNLSDLIESILSNSFNKEHLIIKLISPIVKQIKTVYKEVYTANEIRKQLATQWNEKQKQLQEQFSKLTSLFILLNKETKTNSYNTAIDLEYLKEIDIQLYDSILYYAQRQGENLQKLCLFIQNSATGKDEKINTTLKLLKVKWNEFNVRKLQKAYELRENQARQTVLQYIHNLNVIYTEWKSLDDKNNNSALHKFLLMNSQHLQEKFNLKLPDASKLELDKTYIYRVEKENFPFPSMYLPNFAEMELDFIPLMKDLYEVAYDDFSTRIEELDVEENLKEMSSLDEQLQQLKLTYEEEEAQAMHGYQTDIVQLQTTTLFNLLKDVKSPPNTRLNKAMKNLSLIANRIYSIKEFVEIAYDTGEDMEYWRSLQTIRMQLEQELPGYYFEKWRDKQVEAQKKIYTKWSELQQERNILEYWRNDVLKLVGTAQIRRVSGILLKQNIVNREIMSYKNFALLDEWDYTTPSFLQSDLEQKDTKFGEAFYSNRAFLVHLLLHNERYLPRLMGNFIQYFEANVSNYKNNFHEYKEKVESYQKFDQQLRSSASLYHLENVFALHCPSAHATYKKIMNILNAYEKEMRAFEILKQQRLQNGSVHLNNYKQMSRVFMSKKVRREKRKIIQKIRVINNKQRKAHGELDALRINKNTEIKVLYNEIPTALKQRFEQMNEELRDYTTRINNFAVKQQTINEELFIWNELVKNLNDEPVVVEMNKSFPCFTDIDVEYFKKVQLDKVAYQMSDLQPRLKETELELCPVPKFPKYYIPMPYYLFLAIMFGIGAVVLKWYQTFFN